MFITAKSSQNKNFDIFSEGEIGLRSDSEVIRRWSGSQWEIALEQTALTIKTGGKEERFPCDGTIKLETKRRWSLS